MIIKVFDQIYASKTKCTKPMLQGLYVASFVECGVLQDPLRGTLEHLRLCFYKYLDS